MPRLDPPDDKTITTLYVGGLGDTITETDLRYDIPRSAFDFLYSQCCMHFFEGGISTLMCACKNPLKKCMSNLLQVAVFLHVSLFVSKNFVQISAFVWCTQIAHERHSPK